MLRRQGKPRLIPVSVFCNLSCQSQQYWPLLAPALFLQEAVSLPVCLPLRCALGDPRPVQRLQPLDPTAHRLLRVAPQAGLRPEPTRGWTLAATPCGGRHPWPRQKLAVGAFLTDQVYYTQEVISMLLL
jgi:hypothetical protein